MRYFQDQQCTAGHEVQRQDFFMGCSYQDQDYYYSDHQYSSEILCSEDGPSLPLLSGHNWVVHK